MGVVFSLIRADPSVEFTSVLHANVNKNYASSKADYEANLDLVCSENWCQCFFFFSVDGCKCIKFATDKQRNCYGDFHSNHPWRGVADRC
jgi:hypothetical protein